VLAIPVYATEGEGGEEAFTEMAESGEKSNAEKKRKEIEENNDFDINSGVVRVVGFLNYLRPAPPPFRPLSPRFPLSPPD
jgi:hypothetical protein